MLISGEKKNHLKNRLVVQLLWRGKKRTRENLKIIDLSRLNERLKIKKCMKIATKEFTTPTEMIRSETVGKKK